MENTLTIMERHRLKWHPIKGSPVEYLAKHPHIDFVKGSEKKIAHAKLRAKQRIVAWQRRRRACVHHSKIINDLLQAGRGPSILLGLTPLEVDVIRCHYGVEYGKGRERVRCLRLKLIDKLAASARRKIHARLAKTG